MTEPTGPILVVGTGVAAVAVVATAYTSTEWVTLIGVISGIFIPALIAGVIAIIRELRLNTAATKEATAAAVAVVTKVDAVTEQVAAASAAVVIDLKQVNLKTEAIKTSVDGAASASVAEIKALRQELAIIREERVKDAKKADDLAQAAAVALAQTNDGAASALVAEIKATTDDKGTP